ncbi:hypothetical protein PVAP13_6NG209700 [Panicum virgatum]|uniref:Uncharacterized protein n=1 Tax=Panicum virgatum TaxID=38727 RepID=A0A8T0QY65_PANVG|nr:hypothetical protein PVAP13_6NG209700 [Panicum virgatum]
MQDGVMNFKVHHVKEVYSKLWLYDDSRDQLIQFAVLKLQTIEFKFMLQCLHIHGFTGSAELYYIPPFSKLPAGLVLIDGEEDVKKMVSVHLELSIRNFHLYLVNGGDYIMHSDDDEAPYAYL